MIIKDFEEIELDKAIRLWKRTPENDPYKTGLEELASEMKTYLNGYNIKTAYNEFCYPDIEDAVESINEGQIFHYLNKPWDEIDHKYTIIQALVFHDLSRRNEISANNLKGKIQNLQR